MRPLIVEGAQTVSHDSNSSPSQPVSGQIRDPARHPRAHRHGSVRSSTGARGRHFWVSAAGEEQGDGRDPCGEEDEEEIL